MHECNLHYYSYLINVVAIIHHKLNTYDYKTVNTNKHTNKTCSSGGIGLRIPANKQEDNAFTSQKRFSVQLINIGHLWI